MDLPWQAFLDLFIPKATLLGLFLGMFSVAFTAWRQIACLQDEKDRLESENRRLREWQGAQGKTPDLGAHRTAGFGGGTGEHCRDCGVPHLFCNCTEAA